MPTARILLIPSRHLSLSYISHGGSPRRHLMLPTTCVFVCMNTKGNLAYDFALSSTALPAIPCPSNFNVL